MFNLKKQQSLILLGLTFLIELILIIYTCSQKKVHFVDELWEITEATSPEPTYGPVSKDLFDTWIPHERWDHIFNLDSKLRFSYFRIMKNLKSDTHPPLSFFALHTMSSLSSGKASKWHMIIPNMIFFFISLYFLYKIMFFLTGNYLVSNLTVLLYSLSRAGFFFVTYIKSYEIFIALSIMSCYAHLKIFSYLMSPEKDKFLPNYIVNSLIGVGACYFFGLFNHYYFIIWAFFLSLTTLVICFIRNKTWLLCNYLIASLVPLILNWIIFRPSFLFFMGKDKPGFSSLGISKIFSKEFLESIEKVFSYLSPEIYVKHWIITLLVGAFVVILTKIIKITYKDLVVQLSYTPLNLSINLNYFKTPQAFFMLTLVISSVCSFCIVSVFTWFFRMPAMRYVCFVIPVFFIFIGWCIKNKAMFIVVFLSFLISLIYLKPTDLPWIHDWDPTLKYLEDNTSKDNKLDSILYYPEEPDWHPLIHYTKYTNYTNRFFLSSSVDVKVPTDQTTKKVLVFFLKKMYQNTEDVPDPYLDWVGNHIGLPFHKYISKDIYGSSYVFSKEPL